MQKEILIQQISCHLLAEALSMFLPKARNVELSFDAKGFSCSFEILDLFPAEMLPHIQKRMLSHLKDKKVSIRHILKQNAAAYLKNHGLQKRVKELSSWSDGIITLLQIEGYVGFCIEDDFEAALENCRELELFEVIKSPVKENTFVISGIAAADHADLKSKAEKVEFEKRKGHMAFGHNQALYTLCYQKGSPYLCFENKGLLELEKLEKTLAHAFSVTKKIRVDADPLEKDFPFVANSYCICEMFTENEGKDLFTAKRRTEIRLFLTKSLESVKKVLMDFHKERGINLLEKKSASKEKIFTAKNFFQEELVIASLHPKEEGCMLSVLSLEALFALILEKNNMQEKR